MTRALSSSTEQVLALAAGFSKEADSYLVCIQNEDGNYQTQAINIHNKPRQSKPVSSRTGSSVAAYNLGTRLATLRYMYITHHAIAVTGAGFVVFNANLKSSGGVAAKSSIVEDGLMVQLLPETMLQLRDALRDMRDYSIQYGGAAPGEPDESVVVKWTDDDKDFNVGLVCCC